MMIREVASSLSSFLVYISMCVCGGGGVHRGIASLEELPERLTAECSVILWTKTTNNPMTKHNFPSHLKLPEN